MQLSEYSVKKEWDKTFANKVGIGPDLMSKIHYSSMQVICEEQIIQCSFCFK